MPSVELESSCLTNGLASSIPGAVESGIRLFCGVEHKVVGTVEETAVELGTGKRLGLLCVGM